MSMAAAFEPVRTIIAWKPLEFLAPLALASPFLISGVVKLIDFRGTARGMSAFGLAPHALLAVLVIATQLGGSVLFLTQRFCWLGAGMLAGFTALATLLAHPFWAFEAPDRMRQMMTFFEHLAIIGGFAVAAILVNGRSQQQ